MNDQQNDWKKKFGVGFLGLAVSGSLLLLALFVTALKEYQYVGRDFDQQTTITVSGEGEEYAAPDIAQVSFGVTQESKTATEARNTVSEKTNNTLAFLKESGVAEKDIKTTSYSLNPKYEWEQKQIVCIAYPCIQPPGKQVLVGYEVTQWIEVKVRNLDDGGNIVGGGPENGATNVRGPNFKIENKNAVIAKAREEAINEAKEKANVLADQLGVKLVRVVSFSEGYDYPIYGYGRGGDMAVMKAEAAPAPILPAGENQYVSNVTIVYEIR